MSAKAERLAKRRKYKAKVAKKKKQKPLRIETHSYFTFVHDPLLLRIIFPHDGLITKIHSHFEIVSGGNIGHRDIALQIVISDKKNRNETHKRFTLADIEKGDFDNFTVSSGDILSLYTDNSVLEKIEGSSLTVGYVLELK